MKRSALALLAAFAATPALAADASALAYPDAYRSWDHVKSMVINKGHPLYAKLAEAKAYYWDIYKEKAKLPAGMKLYKYAL
jgi:hypothetical protein